MADPHSHFRILGRDRWNVWELRRHIGVVSQDLQQRYLPTATAHDVALSGFFASIGVHGTLAARVTAAQHAKARAVLDAAGLAGHGDTPLKRLSTGEQRRCLLARALVHDPHTLVLDEPTAGLDLAGSFEYFDRLAALARRGCSLVLVTHHLNEIPPELDRVILLHEGRIVADGPKFEVLRPEILAPVYGVNLRIARIDGHYLAYPAARESRKRDL